MKSPVGEMKREPEKPMLTSRGSKVAGLRVVTSYFLLERAGELRCVARLSDEVGGAEAKASTEWGELVVV